LLYLVVSIDGVSIINAYSEWEIGDPVLFIK
jgi:hypothetical protein